MQISHLRFLLRKLAARFPESHGCGHNIGQKTQKFFVVLSGNGENGHLLRACVPGTVHLVRVKSYSHVSVCVGS